MRTLDDFPGAPVGSYVNEDGWLITHDCADDSCGQLQAWTIAEWAATTKKDRPQIVTHSIGRPLLYNDHRHAGWREKQRRAYARKQVA